jgi:HK97 family phage portal protein
MGLLNWLRGTDLLEERSTQPNGESRSLPAAENELPLYGGYTSSTVTPIGALGIADVWSAVRVLADAASSLPLHVYRAADDGGRERVRSGKLADLLDRPGPATSQADLVSSLMSHLLIWGNAYVAKYRDANGEIAAIGLLLPDRVRPELNGGRVRWRFSPPTGRQQLLTEADVVHVRGLSTDGLIGLSAVSQASRVLGLSDELVKHALEFFEQGRGLPAGVFKMPEGSSEPARQRMVESLRNEMRQHGLLVIEGEGSLEPLTLKLDDSQFVEQRRLAAQEIARVFRIPPNMIGAGSGGDSLTYSTVEQNSLDFVRYSLSPWLRRIELAISNDADLAFQKQYVKFELDGLLRADAKSRAEIYHLALDPVQGWLDVDEVRRLEDLPPRTAAVPMNPIVNGIPMPKEAVNGSG